MGQNRAFTLILTQTGKRIQKLLSDNGGEYTGNKSQAFMKSVGMRDETTPVGTPQMNGKSERRNLTLMNMVRPLLAENDSPARLWAEAARYANFLLNRMSPKGQTKSRFELIFGRKPPEFRAAVFGSKVYYRNNDEHKKKLDDRAFLGIFVGYNDEGVTYRIYDPARRLVVTSRDVVFFDTDLEGDLREEGDIFTRLKIDEEPLELVPVKDEVAESADKKIDDEDSSEEEEELRPQMPNEALLPNLQQQLQLDPPPMAPYQHVPSNPEARDLIRRNSVFPNPRSSQTLPTVGRDPYPMRATGNLYRSSNNHANNNNINNNINNNANNDIHNNANNNIN
ncbi:MAG TPA: hypothetical protein VER35_01290, partial [Candidatus Limnocylindrales bacterium]|nr:hypothetical protein [Candidatus Limnocylindrales bacterium]